MAWHSPGHPRFPLRPTTSRQTRHLERRLPVSGLERGPGCHPERSEGSLRPASQTLRCAQGDRPSLQMSIMLVDIVRQKGTRLVQSFSLCLRVCYNHAGLIKSKRFSRGYQEQVHGSVKHILHALRHRQPYAIRILFCLWTTLTKHGCGSKSSCCG